jgi:hypothetical protein
METLNFDKLKSVVHYVCYKATDPSVLGAVKLNKVLWYSDALTYLTTGKSITGETYIKRQHGPVPQHILRVVDSLVAEKKIARGKVDHFGFMKNEYIAISEPDFHGLSASSISLIDEAFEHVCMKNTACSISEETHGVIWNMAEMGESIPYSTIFASSVGEIDESDIEWAINIVNGYSQFGCGVDRVRTEYEHVRNVFKKVKELFTGKRIGYPLYGAGGDWNIISQIIDEELKDENHTLVKYKRS